MQNLNSLLAPFSATQKVFFEEEFEGSNTLTCSNQLIRSNHVPLYIYLYIKVASYQKIFEIELVMNLVPATGSG